MDANDDLYGKELNLNCFYMHAIIEQKYTKPAIVISKGCGSTWCSSAISSYL